MTKYNSKNHDELESAWQPCPVGSLRQSSRGHKINRRSALLKVAVATGVLATGVIARHFMVKEKEQPVEVAVPLSCRKVIRDLDCYIAGRLDCPLKIKAVKRHLKRCKSCQDKYSDRLNAAFQSPATIKLIDSKLVNPGVGLARNRLSDSL